jgi:gluconate:H+ symporter, GntP family
VQHSILHIAMGSISIAAIIAAGILAPIAGSLGIPVVLIALAARGHSRPTPLP